MLPLVYTSGGFGPLYLNSVLSAALVFRIKQDAAIKVSAGFRGSWGSGRQGRWGDFFLCWWKMLHWQLWTLKSWVYPKNTQGLIRGKTTLTPTSLPGLAGPQPKCPQPWPEPLHGGGPLGLHIRFPLSSCVKALCGALLWSDSCPMRDEQRKPNASWAFFTSLQSHLTGIKWRQHIPGTIGWSRMEARGWQTSSDPELWYNTSVTVTVLTNSWVSHLLLRAFREISGIPIEGITALLWLEKAENINCPLRVKSKYKLKIPDYKISSLQKVESNSFPHHSVYAVPLASKTGDSPKIKIYLCTNTFLTLKVKGTFMIFISIGRTWICSLRNKWRRRNH